MPNKGLVSTVVLLLVFLLVVSKFSWVKAEDDPKIKSEADAAQNGPPETPEEQAKEAVDAFKQLISRKRRSISDETSDSTDVQNGPEQTSEKKKDAAEELKDLGIRKKRGAADFGKGSDKVWAMPIRYSLNKKLPKKTREMLKEAMDYISERTCVQFKQGKSKDYLDIIPTKKKCSSFYGRQGGGQVLAISDQGAEGCLSLPLLSHEIFHALGLEHEMKRPDRKKFVKVLKANVKNTKQFDVRKDLEQFGPYELQSVMQYDDKFLRKKEGTKTLEPIDKDLQYWVRRSTKTYSSPSFHDIMAINELYGCTDKCGNKKCKNGGYKAGPKCKCQCPPGFKGKDCEKRKYDGCGGEIKKKSGEISTPNFSKSVFSKKKLDKKCSWLIKGKEGDVILLSFHDHFFTEDGDQGSKNYVEVRPEGEDMHGPRLYGSKDFTKMAYEIKGPNAYIEMGVSGTNGYGVGFRATYQVIKASDHKKCEHKLCYNGGSLKTKGCKCSCLKGYTGDKCEKFKNKECNKKAPCQNRGVLQVNKKGCPCECPSDPKMPAKIQGDRCQYFGYCHQRLDASVVDMLAPKKLQDDGICSQMKQCDNSLDTMARCPILCGTSCECIDVLPQKKPGKTCAPMKDKCNHPKGAQMMGVMCQKTCDKCPADD